MNSSDAVIREITQHTYGTWRAQDQWVAPVLIEDAQGVNLTASDGRTYLDFSSQLMCSNLGHKNEAVIEAIVQQARHLPYVAPGFTSKAVLNAVRALRGLMPGGMDKFFFSTSGTEANEAAIKMARQMKSPRYKIFSRYRSYHGATATSITLTGDPRRVLAERARSTVEGVRFAPDAYCYRCPFQLSYPNCDLQCATYVEYMLKEEGNVAAMIVEPVVGTNGRIVPPPEYFPLLREICDRQDLLLIADEVMSGWYRTGKPFAIQHWGVVPDILTTAKGCTSAYAPAGITVTTREVADYFEEVPLDHGHTYANHPLVLAPIPAVIDEYKKLVDSGHLEATAAYLKQRVLEVAERHPCVGDARGIGHFWALELVKNRKTREPFNTKMDKFSRTPIMTNRVAAKAMENGVYFAVWYDTIMIAPPLIVERDQIDHAMQVLDEALEISDEETVFEDVPLSISSEYSD
jgi:taurine--2-oxoglutarate transaminase